MRLHCRATGSYSVATTRELTVRREVLGTDVGTADFPLPSYGVVRVYSRQYAYVLSDAETIKANIRTLLKAVKTSELDPNAGRVR